MQAQTQYTENDPSSKIAITAPRVSVTAAQRQDTYYVYRDFGDNHFNGDFIGGGAFRVSSAANLCFCSLSLYTNVVKTVDALYTAGDDYIGCRINQSAGQLDVIAIENDSGTLYSSGDIVISTATDYWYVFERVDAGGANGFGTIYLRVYDDIALTSQVGSTVSIALHTSKKDYKYHFSVNNWVSAGVSAAITMTQTYIRPEVNNAVIGLTSHTDALSWPGSSLMYYDGLNKSITYFDDITDRRIRMAYIDADGNVGYPHSLPVVGPVVAANELAMYWNYVQTYGIYFACTITTASKFIAPIYKHDDSLSESSQGSASWPAISEPNKYPSNGLDRRNFVCIAGMKGTAPSLSLILSISTEPFNADDAFDTAITVKSLGSDDCVSALAFFSNYDRGVAYCVDTATPGFFFRHWDFATTTLGSEETIDSNVKTYYSFAVVTTRNDKTFAVYRDRTNNKLYYRIRTAGSGGSWGADTLIDVGADDTALNDGYGFTITANFGIAESVYIFYYDSSDNIRVRNWNGTTMSSSSVFVATVSPKTYRLTSSDQETREIPVAYHTSADEIRYQTQTITPPANGVDGVLISLDGDETLALTPSATHIESASDFILMVFITHSHEFLIGLYDESVPGWVTNPLVFTNRNWDLHSRPGVTKDADGYITLTWGGRASTGNPVGVQVWKSDYPLGHANFTIDAALTDWTDISPTALTTNFGGVFTHTDRAGQIWMSYPQSTALDIAGIQEYSGGSWSSAVDMVDLSGSAVLYIYFQAMLDKTAAGQKELFCVGSYYSEALTPILSYGAVVNVEIFFWRMVRTSKGAYTAKRADGTAITLPIREDCPGGVIRSDMIYSGEAFTVWPTSTAVSAGDKYRNSAGTHVFVVAAGGGGTTDASEPTWDLDHHSTTNETTVVWIEVGKIGSDWPQIWSDIEIIGTVTPCGVFMKRSKSGDNDLTDLVFYRKDAAEWKLVDIDTSGFSGYFVPKIALNSSGVIYVIAVKTISSVKQMVYYSSADNGDTWSSATQKTNALFDVGTIQISHRSGTSLNVLWNEQISAVHSEVRFDNLTTPITLRSSLGGLKGPLLGPFGGKII